MKFRIESGIAVPRHKATPAPRRKLKYPFLSMKVGDSFLVPCSPTQLKATQDG